jgi:hypothetical protein
MLPGVQLEGEREPQIVGRGVGRREGWDASQDATGTERSAIVPPTARSAYASCSATKLRDVPSSPSLGHLLQDCTPVRSGKPSHAPRCPFQTSPCMQARPDQHARERRGKATLSCVLRTFVSPAASVGKERRHLTSCRHRPQCPTRVFPRARKLDSSFSVFFQTSMKYPKK